MIRMAASARPDLLHRGSAPVWQVGACLGLAALLILVTAMLGVPERTPLGGHDADFAIRALVFLERDWASPGLPPAWLADMQGGFGGPLFQFYPPLAFLMAFAIERTLQLDPITTLLVTVAVGRGAAMGACFLWLRCHVSRPAASLGAATYALLPFTAVIDPTMRFAFSETMATALLPLLPMAIDAPALRGRVRIALFSAAFAMVILTNIPTALTMGLVCAVYALALQRRQAGVVVAGGSLGMALAAWHLVPAMLGADAISTSAMLDEGHRWTGTMLFWGEMALHRPNGIWILLYGTLLALGALGWIALLRGGRAARPVTVGGLAALAMCTPLSIPVWLVLPVLDYVQFPWRFLLPATLFAAAQVAWLAERGVHLRWLAGLVFAAGVASALVVPASHLKPAHAIRFVDPQARLTDALAIGEDPVEYLPAAARDAGWLNVRQPDPARLPVALEGTAQVATFARTPGTLRIAGIARGQAALLLPQFWTADWEADGGYIASDPTTGLIRLDVPDGAFDAMVRRGPTAYATAGTAVSVAALLVAAALGLWRPARVSDLSA